jgi:hypothetical protein
VSRLEIAGFIIVAVGMVGYMVSLIILWRFWRWMGQRGNGWPRLLLRTLIVLLALLGALYTLSLLGALGLVPDNMRVGFNFALGTALALAPWTVVGGLWRWWGWRWRQERANGGIP